MFKKIILLVIFLLPVIVFADPKPFGLQIGQTTIKEVQNKFKVKYAGINKYSQGKMFYLNPKDLNFDGLEEVLLIFSKDKKLLAVLLQIQKSRFDDIFNLLNSKYKLLNKRIPFVGNKEAKFINGNTEIILYAPHMSFDMKLYYIDKDLWKIYKQTQQKEQIQKEKREASQL
jgi:hypothetical protein